MLKKLSLAALVAMGSMSFANATPLTEAIKNVNFSGYLRLRIYNESNKTHTNRYRTTALFKFSVPVSEELKFNTSYAYDWNIYSDGAVSQTKDSKGDTTNIVAPAPGNVKFFLQYSANNINAIVGKIPVNTPVTATGVGEATGAGAIVAYKVNDNVTLAAAGLDDLVGVDKLDKSNSTAGRNVYAGAVIFGMDALKGQVWYFNVDDAIDSDIVARVDYKMNNIALHADFATAELNSKITDLLSSDTKDKLKKAKFNTSDTQTYFNVSAKYTQGNLCAKLGYAQTGKDGGIVVLDGDSPIASVLPTEQFTGIANTTDTTALYAKVGNKLDDKTYVFAGGSFVSDKNSKKVNDYIVGVKYKYTKQMKVYAYYDVLNADSDNVLNAKDNNEARIEFKYSF